MQVKTGSRRPPSPSGCGAGSCGPSGGGCGASGCGGGTGTGGEAFGFEADARPSQNAKEKTTVKIVTIMVLTASCMVAVASSTIQSTLGCSAMSLVLAQVVVQGPVARERGSPRAAAARPREDRGPLAEECQRKSHSGREAEEGYRSCGEGGVRCGRDRRTSLEPKWLRKSNWSRD